MVRAFGGRRMPAGSCLHHPCWEGEARTRPPRLPTNKYRLHVWNFVCCLEHMLASLLQLLHQLGNPLSPTHDPHTVSYAAPKRAPAFACMWARPRRHVHIKSLPLSLARSLACLLARLLACSLALSPLSFSSLSPPPPLSHTHTHIHRPVAEHSKIIGHKRFVNMIPATFSCIPPSLSQHSVNHWRYQFLTVSSISSLFFNSVRV
jgi:hypothetical protein